MLLLDLASRIIGLMAVVAIMFGTIERLHIPGAIRRVGHGIAFGIAAAICMLFPVVLPDGTLLSGRSYFLAFSAAFGGVIPFMVAGLITACTRLALNEISLGLLLQPMVAAAAVGLGWRWTVGKWRGRQLSSLLTLGFSTSLLSLFLLIAVKGGGVDVLLRAYPVALLVSLIAAIILGKLIEREVRHFADSEQWRSEALTDALTRLPNRRAFQSDYQDAIKADSPFALIVLDIDHFKKINDVHGHAVGDTVLESLGELLLEASLLNVTAYRLGGEEFAMMAAGFPASDAMRLAEEVRAKIASTRIDACPIVSVSGGVAVFEPGVEGKEVLAAADAALYYAKSSGRNTVKSWTDLVRDQAETPITIDDIDHIKAIKPVLEAMMQRPANPITN